jgi:hypothetical protein
MLCGREPGGAFSAAGVCPAAVSRKFDRIHGGRNAGRVYWVVRGTVCNGKVQDTLAKKYTICGQCDFYTIVKKEEGDKLMPTIFLLRLSEDDA